MMPLNFIIALVLIVGLMLYAISPGELEEKEKE